MPSPENTFSGLRAALRDASWFRRPNTTSKRLTYHVVDEPVSAQMSACGVPVVAQDERLQDTTEAAETIAVRHRCGRPGCRARWPAHLSESN